MGVEEHAAHDAYEGGREKHSRTLGILEGRSRNVGAARLVVAAAAIAVVGGIVWAGLGVLGWAALGLLAMSFVALVIFHARVHDAAERARAGLHFHARGIARLNCDWAALSIASTRFRGPDHPFTADLDVFGRASLMQLIDATETRIGEEKLAGLLSLEGRGAWPDDALARQAAARDLATRFAFREQLATAGAVLKEETPNPADFVAWAEDADEAPTPLSRLLLVVAWLQPAIVCSVIALGPTLGFPNRASTIVSVVAVALGLVMGRRLAPMLEAVSTRESTVTRWRSMIAAIERETFEAPLLRGLRARFDGGGARASEELARLERIVGFADARRNEIFRFFIGPVLMWDVHCGLALRRWRTRAGRRLRPWLDGLAEVEALASLGGFAFEHPDFVWPELADEPVFEGRGLGHPLIPTDRRVQIGRAHV